MAFSVAPPAGAPSLDRSGDVWTGVLPGLGTIAIDADGGITIEVEPAQPVSAGTDFTDGTDDHPDAGEAAELREAALRHGWAEGLSWARRGYELVSGAAVCPPDDEERCLILDGDPHDVAILLIELANRGWSAMGDKYTPTLWQDGALVAAARSAPLIVSARRLAKSELEGTKVRAHTDSRAVDLPRATGTRRVAAFCGLRMRKPDEPVFEVLTGSARFEAAACHMMGGALRPAREDDEPEPEAAADEAPADEAAAAERLAAKRQQLAAEAMAENLRLVALPHVRLSLDSATAADDAAALAAWWDESFGPELAQEAP